MSSENENIRNSKPISLRPSKPEDAIRGALMTPPFSGEEAEEQES